MWGDKGNEVGWLTKSVAANSHMGEVWSMTSISDVTNDVTEPGQVWIISDDL